MKLSTLKLLVVLVVFFGLYISVNFPGMMIQKVSQIISMIVSLGLMVVIMRNPAEQSKRVLNTIVCVLILVLTVFYVLSLK